MEFDHLRSFLAVVEHEGFSRAAEALPLTQPTLSLHVRSLEEALGVKLLDRGARRVRPTAAGRTLVAYAERLLALRREAAERVRGGTDALAGELRLVASTVPGEYLLPRWLARLKSVHPAVDVALRVCDSEEATAAVRAARADLGAVGSRAADRRLRFHALGRDEILLVGSGRGRRAPRGGPGDLRGAPLVVRERGSGTRKAAAGFLAKHRLHFDDLNVVLELGSTEAVKRAVLEGAGHAFLSRLAVRDELRAGRLVAVPMPGLPIVRRFFWVHRAGVPPPAAARVLIEIANREHRKYR